MSNKINMVFVIFCLILFPAGCSDAKEPASLTTGLMKGQLAPDFTLNDINGKKLSLSSFKNKNAVCLVFWATWCPYCVKEIPKLKKIHAKYSGKGVKVISVDIASNDPLKRVLAFQKQFEIPYTILYDENQIASKMYGVTGIPVSIVIDRKGIVQYRDYTLPENIDQFFLNYLNEKN